MKNYIILKKTQYKKAMINKKNIKNLLLNNIGNYIILFEDSSNIYNIGSEFFNEYKFFSERAKKFIEDNFKQYSDTTNNAILGLTNFETYGNQIFIGFEKGDYKTYLATRENNYLQFINENNFFLIPIIINNIIVTSDNKIIIIKTSQYEELIGDFLNVGDIKNEQIDFLESLSRITSKIIGNTIELSDAQIIGVYKANYSCIFVFQQKTEYSSEQILNIFNEYNNNKDVIIEFIENKEDNLGRIICDGCYSKHVRQAFKFYLKENYNSYKYINIKLV